MVYKTKYGLAQKCNRREKKDGPRNRYIKKRKEGKAYGSYVQLFSV